MYARKVSMNLKPNCAHELTRKLENQVIPLLRKQTGFQDEITFVAPGEKKAFGISLWGTKENAEAYNRATYPEVTKLLSGLIEGSPEVESYEVANSTFHKIAATVAA